MQKRQFEHTKAGEVVHVLGEIVSTYEVNLEMVEVFRYLAQFLKYNINDTLTVPVTCRMEKA